jgi:Icc-related predicted phosphoesterase
MLPHQQLCDHSYDKEGTCIKCLFQSAPKVSFQYNTDISYLYPVDYISDLHMDFWVKEINTQSPKFTKQLDEFIKIIKPRTNKILILAGDQGHYFSQDSALLTKLLEYYQHICLVPGNHDMYLLSKSAKAKYQNNSINRILEMKMFCRDNPRLHYLDGNIVCIDGVTIGGIGMYHDYSYGQDNFNKSDDDIYEHWLKTMNDANHIYMGSDNYNIPLAYGAYHKVASFKTQEFFASQLERLQRIDNCQIMVTHYGPRVPDCLPDAYKVLTTAFYYFNGEEEIRRINPKYWIHGHTHMEIDETFEDTHILCNPLGYPSENSYREIRTIYI